MKTFGVNSTSKCILINLQKGEDILASVQETISLHGIDYGMVVSGIGALRRCVYHRITTLEDDPTNQFVTVDGPIEMTALQGLIIDRKPHLHITCCDCEKGFAGHLELGTQVQYLAEIAIMVWEATPLTRKPNAYGVQYLHHI